MTGKKECFAFSCILFWILLGSNIHALKHRIQFFRENETFQLFELLWIRIRRFQSLKYSQFLKFFTYNPIYYYLVEEFQSVSHTDSSLVNC